MGTVPGIEAKVDRLRLSMSKGRKIWLAVLAGVIAVCLVFSYTTRDAMGHLTFLKPGAGAQKGDTGAATKAIVDLSPWQTAQALAALAVSAEEKQDARQAEKLADHEVDQAFASALRIAEAQKPTLSPEAKELTDKVAQYAAQVKQDQAQLTVLGVATGAAGSTGNTAPQGDDVDVAKAQLGLDTDELTDAQQDLARATGDDRTRIQQELAAHEAAMAKYNSQAGDAGELAVISSQRHGSLAGRIGAWWDQRSRRELLLQAEQASRDEAAKLTKLHNALETASNGTAAAAPDAASKLAILKSKAAQRQLMSIYDDRIQTEQQLATTYATWAAQVQLQHRIVLHLMVQSVAGIALILLFQFFVDLMIGYWSGRPNLDQRRLHTLRTILKVSVQILSVVLILMVIFGKPEQISTVLGLATAGLTVALQSYIVGFCGWFVLMGRNGIRVGDSVEINGVGGEVAEIGLFRTMLLETGNWTAKGHPTGRLVAFMNTFAVTGQYFNFSTAGQWMWDEITVSVPTGEDTYKQIEAIHAEVTKETEEAVASAEAEWRTASRGNGLSQFSAAPTVNLRPAASGVDVVVRYVTSASGRFETRNHLYQTVLKVLGKGPEPTPEPDAEAETKG